jgi:phosphoribosylaminoimidazole-succinocarboxamide synthase
VNAKELLYEGKAKKVYASTDPAIVIVEFKDDATAFNGAKKGQISQKGAANAAITTKLFQILEASGVPTHLQQQLYARRVALNTQAFIKLQVVVRKTGAGDFGNMI